MMLRSSVRNFGKLCRYHPSFAALSILSLLITTLSFLVLMEKSYYTYQVSLTQEYLYVMDDSPEEICALYHDLRRKKAAHRLFPDGGYAAAEPNRLLGCAGVYAGHQPRLQRFPDAAAAGVARVDWHRRICILLAGCAAALAAAVAALPKRFWIRGEIKK